jgi:membrane fusion protein (multidrug efflux system)
VKSKLLAGEMPDLYVVKSGITENDNLLEGVQIVKDDDKIKYVYQKPEVVNHLKLKAE